MIVARATNGVAGYDDFVNEHNFYKKPKKNRTLHHHICDTRILAKSRSLSQRKRKKCLSRNRPSMLQSNKKNRYLTEQPKPQRTDIQHRQKDAKEISFHNIRENSRTPFKDLDSENGILAFTNIDALPRGSIESFYLRWSKRQRCFVGTNPTYGSKILISKAHMKVMGLSISRVRGDGLDCFVFGALDEVKMTVRRLLVDKRKEDSE